MKQKKYNILVIGIIILAIIVRLIYVIKTPFTEKQHDVEPNGNGLSYIFSITDDGKLPSSNRGQYYHPPLHQIICAGWVKVISIFNSDKVFLCESLQFVTLIYSMLIILVMNMIFKEFNFSNKIKLILNIVLALHPTLIILAGSINNDELCALLTLVAALFLIKWYKSDSLKDLIILAISTGLSVMTKTSGGLIAFPITYIFIKKLFKELNESKNQSIIIKKNLCIYVLFGCISLPIGLWYPIRNNILFGQPILYVMDPHNADLYVGNCSFLERFLPFSSEIGAMYCDPWTHCNIPIYLLKCSLYGEYSWIVGGIYNILYYSTIIINIFFILYILYCVIKNSIKKSEENNELKISLVVLFLINLFSYLSINIELPYGCTMDFRYIIPTLFVGFLFIGFELKNIEKSKYKNIVYYIVGGLTSIMLVFSNIIILS